MRWRRVQDFMAQNCVRGFMVRAFSYGQASGAHKCGVWRGTSAGSFVLSSLRACPNMGIPNFKIKAQLSLVGSNIFGSTLNFLELRGSWLRLGTNIGCFVGAFPSSPVPSLCDPGKTHSSPAAGRSASRNLRSETFAVPKEEARGRKTATRKDRAIGAYHSPNNKPGCGGEQHSGCSTNSTRVGWGSVQVCLRLHPDLQRCNIMGACIPKHKSE